jgi:AraC-like DNA-binding protein
MGYVKYDCIDVYIDNLKELDLVATQITKGPFFSQKHNLKLPLMEISHWHVDVGILYHGSLVQDKVMISLPIKRSSHQVDGSTFGSDSIFVIFPDEKLLALFPKCTESLDFLIPLSVLQEHYNCKSISSIAPLLERLRNKKNYSDSETIQIKQLTQYAISVMDKSSRLSFQEILDAQDSILLMIFNIIGGGGEQKAKSGSQNRVTVVKRALTTIHSNTMSNLTILELSAKCFCSIRTLEYSFKSILGFSPKDYLVKRRLNLIRQELKRSPEKSISRIATDFGVVNVGRLSKDYFIFFGEYPSDTRNKSINLQ